MFTRTARKVVVFVAGGLLTLLGLVMLVTPGPGIPFLLAGMALLAIEFEWAAKRLESAKRTTRNVMRRN